MAELLMLYLHRAGGCRVGGGGGMRMGCGKSTGVGGVVGCPGYVELGDNGQGVGEGECGDKEVRDGRGGEGEGIRFGMQWTPAWTQ